MPDSNSKFRVVWKMASGSTRYGNWLSEETAMNLINTTSFLLEGEWIGIQQQGLETEIVHRGPWRRIDNNNCQTY